MPVRDGVEGYFTWGWAGIELSKDFLWSYTWPLWRTVQANMSADPPASAFDSMFVWNEYLTRCRARTAAPTPLSLQPWLSLTDLGFQTLYLSSTALVTCKHCGGDCNRAES